MMKKNGEKRLMHRHTIASAASAAIIALAAFAEAPENAAECSLQIDNDIQSSILFRPIKPTPLSAKRVLKSACVETDTKKLSFFQLQPATAKPFLVEKHMIAKYLQSDIVLTPMEPDMFAKVKPEASIDSIVPTSQASTREIVIDKTRFEVVIDDSTYEELAQMKTEAELEKKYQGSKKQSARLNDLHMLDTRLRRQWVNVLLSNSVCKIQHVKGQEMKATAEAWLDNELYTRKCQVTLLSNLSILKSRGYDTVLVRFDCSEDIDSLLQMAADIRLSGMKVAATYVGRDNLVPRWNPFIKPDVLKTYIAAIAPKADFWMLNWRSTSSHVKLLPAEFFNFMCNFVRECNSSIPIYGEVYYGQIDPIGKVAMAYTSPANVSGYVITNMGYEGYNYAYIANRLFASVIPGYQKASKVGQVIGLSPYYASKHCKGLDVKEEYKHKAVVENGFTSARCSTVTLLHDGVDDNQTTGASRNAGVKYSTTDNLLHDEKLKLLD